MARRSWLSCLCFRFNVGLGVIWLLLNCVHFVLRWVGLLFSGLMTVLWFGVLVCVFVGWLF